MENSNNITELVSPSKKLEDILSETDIEGEEICGTDNDANGKGPRKHGGYMVLKITWNM